MDIEFDKKFSIENQQEKATVFELYCKRIKDVQIYLSSNKLQYICSCKDIISNNNNNNNYSKLKTLSKKKGVYIFYKEVNDNIDYWYIGECHVINGKWDVTSRLKQHFQPSQKSGLLYKVMESEQVDKNKGSRVLKDVKLGFFDLTEYDEAFILLMESILIINCDPEYNKE